MSYLYTSQLGAGSWFLFGVCCFGIILGSLWLGLMWMDRKRDAQYEKHGLIQNEEKRSDDEMQRQQSNAQITETEWNGAEIEIKG